MTDIDWENPFKPEDAEYERRSHVEYGFPAAKHDAIGFYTLHSEVKTETVVTGYISIERANARFREILASCPTVYKAAGYGHFDIWIEDEDELDAPASHEAKLIAIKRIESEK